MLVSKVPPGPQGRARPQGEQGIQGIQGLKGDIGPQGPAGPPGSFTLLSADDETLGVLLDLNPSTATVFIPSLQKVMMVSATSGENSLLAFTVYFTEPGCAGSPFCNARAELP